MEDGGDEVEMGMWGGGWGVGDESRFGLAVRR